MMLRILLSVPLVVLIGWSVARPIAWIPGYLIGVVLLIVLWTKKKEQQWN